MFTSTFGIPHSIGSRDRPDPDIPSAHERALLCALERTLPLDLCRGVEGRHCDGCQLQLPF